MSTQWKRRQSIIAKENKRHKQVVSEQLSCSCKETIRSGSYLGKKGYTIPRELLSESEQEFLHKDLFVKPVSIGPSYGLPGAEDEGAFPVYRENAKKIYIPRFYGLERYGLEVIGREPIEFKSNAINKKYLKTKRDKLGHFILNEE